MTTHDCDLLLIEGTKDGKVISVSCDWKYVEGRRFEIIYRMLKSVPSPNKTYRVLAERENGYMTSMKHNMPFVFNPVVRVEVSLEKELGE